MLKTKISVSVMAAVVIVLTCALLPVTGGRASEEVKIELDCSRISGTIKPFSEINCGPIPIHHLEDGADLTRQYQEIGIPMVRTHDFYGPTDISTIFPDWSADPELASSYDFSETDRHIASIVNGGFEVFYRLGESASDNEFLRQPPSDFQKWAEVCKHIVMHYNDGWADGHHYDIRYWEIWNEPDLDGFWSGTAEQYYELYRTTAELLKAHDPELKVGGPCTSNVADERYASEFLEFVVEEDLPLDFYSWHNYAHTPAELYTNSLAVRSLLDGFGLTECENINTEWNIHILSPQRDNDNAKNAAFTAASLTVLQDAGLDYCFRYRGTQDDSSRLGLVIGFDLSLFTAGGTYKTPALSYLAMHTLQQDSPLRLEAPQMDGAGGVTWLGGISDNGSHITALISNFEAEDTSCDVNISSLPFQGGYRAVRYLIDDRHHLEIVDQTSETAPAYASSFVLEKNSVVLLRLTQSTVLPPEGPEVAEIPLLLQLKILDPFFQLLGIWLLLLIFN